MKKILLCLVAAACLLLIPMPDFGQTPVVGAAAKFALFTSAGAVGNTQRSYITGDVGTGVGAVTDFGNVDGVIHFIPDGSTGAAVGALTTLSNDLTARTQTGTHAPAFGTETIAPGVYDIAGNATLNGNLTLDAGADPSAVFIFRIAGPFAVSIPFSVILANGAVACNVFWKIGGVVSLNGGIMKGTILSGAAINMSPGVNLEGRAFSTVGAINISQVTVYMPLGCGAAALTGPVAPDLLTLKNFGLFTSSGAVSDAGSSYVIGDVGSNSEAPSGFDASDVSGTLHGLPNIVTAQASADIIPVYNDLNGRIHDINLLIPADFGYNLVLTPHTYLLDAATVLTGNVILNAQGNPDAVFILKVTGAFSTGTDAKVMLINGTQAKNVYWKIDGAVDIAVNSHFAGTMIVNAGAVKLQTGVRLDGRAYTKVGAVSMSAALIAMYPDGTLPVTWLSFTGEAAGDNVLLDWSTVSELNNGFFTIQKSKDGRNFEVLATVVAHGKITDSKYQYSFTDKFPYSSGFYSISQTDKDGQKSIYKTIQVKININAGFKAFHYSEQNNIYVKASGAAPGKGSLKVFSLDGKLMSSQIILLTKDPGTYKINRQLLKGIYLIRLESDGTKLYNEKVMVF